MAREGSNRFAAGVQIKRRQSNLVSDGPGPNEVALCKVYPMSTGEVETLFATLRLATIQ